MMKKVEGMSESLPLLAHYVSEAGLAEIDQWIQKYPAEHQASAVMRALMIVQEAQGYLQQVHMDAVAAYLSMPPIAVYEVASFYTMYEKNPTGRHVIHVCTNISCQLRRSADIVASLEQALGVRMGETTPDGRFTLKQAECLGACVNAPMMQIDKNYHEHLTPESVISILKQYES